MKYNHIVVHHRIIQTYCCLFRESDWRLGYSISRISSNCSSDMKLTGSPHSSHNDLPWIPDGPIIGIHYTSTRISKNNYYHFFLTTELLFNIECLAFSVVLLPPPLGIIITLYSNFIVFNKISPYSILILLSKPLKQSLNCPLYFVTVYVLVVIPFLLFVVSLQRLSKTSYSQDAHDWNVASLCTCLRADKYDLATKASILSDKPQPIETCCIIKVMTFCFQLFAFPLFWRSYHFL